MSITYRLQCDVCDQKSAPSEKHSVPGWHLGYIEFIDTVIRKTFHVCPGCYTEPIVETEQVHPTRSLKQIFKVLFKKS